MPAPDENKPLRYACDRCHSQKLRCPRSVDSNKSNPDEPCSRCRTAGVPCIVSLRGKVGRPSKVAKKKAVRSPRACLTPDIEFASYDAAGVLGPNGGELDAQMGSNARDRLADMLDLDSASLSGTVSPKMMTTFDLDKPSGALTGPLHSAGPHYMDKPSSGMTPYEPFSLDFADTDVELPTFYLGTDMPDVLAPTATMIDPSIVLNDMMEDRPLVMDPALTKMPTVTVSVKAIPVNDPMPMDLHMSMPLMDGLGLPFSTEAPLPLSSFCSTACYQRLSDLNGQILATSAATNSRTSSSQILKDVVGFSGVLIDTARQSMPYFVGSSPRSSRAGSRADDSGASDDGEAMDTVFSVTGMSGMAATKGMNEWSSFNEYSRSQSVPESAVIFLLLGCYTQILHLFEVTTNSLWNQHCEATEMKMMTKEDHAGTVGSLLEASLAIHTVTYLLSRLHRALAVQDLDDPEGCRMPETFDPQGWKRSFVGGIDLEDGLLGRAFGEIKEREQWLMRRTQLLQQRINKCHI